MVNQAMGVGRAGNPLDQLAKQLRGMFGTVDARADRHLQRRGARARALRRSPTPRRSRRATPAITFENGEYVVTPGIDGQSVNVDDAVAQALAAVSAATVGDTR